MIISQGVFLMLNFYFLVRQAAERAKKWPTMSKISVCCTSYFKNHIAYDFHLGYTCMYKRIISPDIFFIFFKILIFGIIMRDGEGR